MNPFFNKPRLIKLLSLYILCGNCHYINIFLVKIHEREKNLTFIITWDVKKKFYESMTSNYTDLFNMVPTSFFFSNWRVKIVCYNNWRILLHQYGKETSLNKLVFCLLINCMWQGQILYPKFTIRASIHWAFY